jgi:hypothetical protein
VSPFEALDSDVRKESVNCGVCEERGYLVVTFFIAATAFLLSHVGVAGATNSTLLAEKSAFLLGNAQRCGIANERLARAGAVIHDIIVAASSDANDQDS